MKRFGFRLQTLLEMKRRREEDLARRVAEKNNEIILTQKGLRECHNRLSQFQSDEKRRRTLGLSAFLLRLSIAHRHTLQRDIEDAGRRLAGLRLELQAAVHSLTEAKKETRTLEILRDKKQSEWKLEYAREEQAITDDVSQKGHIRKSKAAGATHGA
jgi:flagellar protein FliJ